MPLVQTRGAASAQGFGEFAQAAAAIPYIEDVFSTYLYTGTGAAQTITNNIDLSGKGGLVWIKNRTMAAQAHALYDTVRGVENCLKSNTTAATDVRPGGLTTFSSSGFSVGTYDMENNNGSGIASWTFRKQPKFFDVVTWTGTGSNTTIAHSLGSVPACIMVKRTDTTADWAVYHRSLANTQYLVLNSTAAVATGATWWNSTTPTSAVFSVGTDASVNASGGTYVAYVFAHDAGGFGLTGTDNVISCGSYTGTGSPLAVTLGYEPQWVMIKESSAAGNDWLMFDNMRGMPVGSNDAVLRANTSAAEGGGEYITPTATGFILGTAPAGINDSGFTYIYIAIRRGPMKVPTSGTSVFYPQAIAQADSPDSSGVPFPPDLVNMFSRNGTDRTSEYDLFQFADRLRGLGTPANTQSTMGPTLISSSTAAELSASSYIQLKADSQNITRGTGWNSANYGNWISYFWRRSPSVFDVVCYTGTGVARTVTHNLAAVPEMMIVKERSGTGDWSVYNKSLGSGSPQTKALYLSFTNAESTDGVWNNTAPTSSVFSVSSGSAANGSGLTYVAYLFATCAGVSKVGSYTGTGTTLQIDCGFTGGARFVLIKRTDSTGAWYVWDTARGIIAGNDPYLLLNSTAAEVTSTDYIDTYSAGFEISSTAPAAINASAGTFVFLAVA